MPCSALLPLWNGNESEGVILGAHLTFELRKVARCLSVVDDIRSVRQRQKMIKAPGQDKLSHSRSCSTNRPFLVFVRILRYASDTSRARNVPDKRERALREALAVVDQLCSEASVDARDMPGSLSPVGICPLVKSNGTAGRAACGDCARCFRILTKHTNPAAVGCPYLPL